MRTPLIFLLLYMGAMGFGPVCSAVQNQTSGTSVGLTAEQCTDLDGPTQSFLMCAGVPSEPDADHVLHLKGLISAALDVYSFMRSSVAGVPVVDLSGGFDMTEDHVIKAWLDIKLTPLLSSISRNFLTCLSNRNFSCSAYQTVVKELSQHFSGLDPVRQKWIYSFFMYPFLSRNTSSGCVDPEDSTEDWLTKNFGSFSVLAQVRDFTSINVLFSGLEVLHLLSPEQKAELLLHPEVVGLTNSSLALVFQSLLSSLMPSEDPWPSNNSTQFYMSTAPSASPQDPLGQALNGFMTAFSPVGSFVRQFVSLTQQQNLNSMRSATLVQAMINLTLAELAAPFKQNSSQQLVAFDPMNVNDWFTHVASPILRRFLLPGQIEIHPNLTAVFHNQFYIETAIGTGVQNEGQDICSVFIDNRTCGLTDLVEHVATVLHCAARSNLTLNQETLSNVLLHLSQNLNALLQQLTMTNFSSQSSPFSDILDQMVHDTFTMSNLQDESFVRLWFQVKLKPLLSTLTPEYLTCLSHKEFSCHTFQILVSELSDNMLLMSEEGVQDVYLYFISSFLSRQNVSGGCRAENSSIWVTLNFGGFSPFATLREMYQLSQDFNAIDALVVLSPRQTAELIVEDFAGLPEKSVIINMVFDHILISPEDRGLVQMLGYLIMLAGQMGLECSSYQQIVQRLQESVLPPHMMQPIKDYMSQLEQMAPPGCFLPPVTCISTPINETSICNGISSNETLLSAGLVSAPCSVDLQQYACSSLTGFTAENLAGLLKCQLSSSSSYSKVIWKLLFIKANDVLDGALIIFTNSLANMSQPIGGDVVSQVLDVIGELRLERISPDQWSDVTFISMLFTQNLKPFLQFASPSLLQCTSSKNLSCQTYQHILSMVTFVSETQGRNMVDFFILPFLRRNTTDAGCVSTANNSTEWLQKNFGPFSQFVSLTDLLSINGLFNPLETLDNLTPKQVAGLMAENLPGLPEKEVIINRVFDHLLVSPVERGLPDVLQNLLLISQMTIIPCSSYILIFQRLFQALPFLLTEMETVVLHVTEELKQNGARDCSLPEPPTCLITPVNATRVCSGVNSNETLLSAGLVSAPCSVDLQQYACSSLTGFTAENLAGLLKCQLSSSSSYSKEIWKLLFIKANDVLDGALIIFTNSLANMSQPIGGDVVSQVLDVIGELRLERISPDQWSDVTFISMLFTQNLKPFLQFASPSLLQCTSSKNLSCQTYQHILSMVTFVSETQGRNMVDFFILPFLRRNTTDAGCVSTANNSTEWLQKNFGPFSQFVSLTDLLSINGLFNPLETLDNLTPKQMVGLIVNSQPGVPQNVVINRVFDHLLVSPVERGLPDVLELLYIFSTVNPLSCQTNQIIFTRLEHILRSGAGDLEPVIWASVYKFSRTAPADCALLPVVNECPVTPFNETRVCSGVDSSASQQCLIDGLSCGFGIAVHACSPVLNVSLEHLVTLLHKHLSTADMSSAEAWKLFLTRVSHLLDVALSQLSNKSMWWSSSSASVVLDVLRELRLNRLTDESAVAQWLDKHLRPVLPSVSTTFLQCLRSKNFSCQSFQTVVGAFDAGYIHMNDFQRQITVSDFIIPFLSRAGAACVSNDNSQWLISNFGQFSALVPLNQLISLNAQFNPMSSLLYLSPEQLVGLMFDDIPGLPEKSVVINAVFDHLTASPQKQRIVSMLPIMVESSTTRNVSCASYQTIFHRLDHLMVSVPVDLEAAILRSKSALLRNVPQGCVSSSRQCGFTPVNETALCRSINSSVLLAYLGSSHDGSRLCEFSITQYACAELTDLSSQDLATVLSCGLNGNENVSEEMWKLFTQKINPVLGPALDLLADTRLNKSRPSVSFLNVIGEVTLSSFSSTNLGDHSFVQRWFNSRLRPFLPYASEMFLSCLSTRDFSCDTFRSVVESFGQSFDVMSTDTQANVYVDFIKVFLSQNSTAGCVNISQSSSDWLISSFGRFAVFTTVTDLQTLNPNFNVLDTLGLLSMRQLVEVSSTPGFLSSSAAVNNLLLYVPDAQFTAFFLSLSNTLQIQGVVLPPPVQEAFLQQVFDRANLTTSSDADLQNWILNMLPSFMANITVQHVTSYFSIIQQRPCSISQQAVQLLNTSSSTFQPATQDQIYQLILGSLTGPAPLRCYANQSYYAFLTSSFMSFQFPNLTTFLSLMPAARVPELMESVSPAEVSSLLNRPNAVDDVTKICQFFRIYPKTPQYLQTEPPLSVGLAQQVLSCVWPQVLKVDSQSEANTWFDHRLLRYLPLLTSQLISPDVMQNASCLSFKKFVSVMAKYDYAAAPFSQRDIYNTILIYLNTSSTPKCYNASNPDLNSTAWFVDYISVFLSFITLDDLLMFGSIQPFMVNLENLQLFGQISVPDDVMEYYVTLLFDLNPSFSAYYLPLKFRCLAPASSFLELSSEQLRNISSSIHQNCTDVLPEVSAALASNAEVLTVDSIQALGQSCTGLSTAQISGAGGQVLFNALSVLSLVQEWNLDQAMMIIRTLLSSGVYQINSAASLQNLGSLIVGVQSSIMSLISGNTFLEAMKSELFMSNIIGAPVIVQQTVVSQIISVSSSSDAIITNVPDVMATEIPRVFLLGVSTSSATLQTVNQKKWKHEQAVLIFETVAAQFSNPDDMSFQVLQGFTCSRIQSFSTSKIMNLIRGCKRRVNQTLVLQESQLTCMYQYIKSADLNAFSQYPAEVLIYYDYSAIDRSVCRSYFSSLGTASFSVLSSTLSFKKQTLFNNARDCLGISGFKISRDQLEVLGSVCCFLSADYIQSSDPYVLEKLKQCEDLSAQQISALESVLLGGNTSYGPSDSWNRTTLENLGLLPLYLTTNIWGIFSQTNKQRFLKTFIHDLRKNNKASEMKILNMMNEVNKISRVKIKRSAETACTVGQILQAQVYSDMFPFAYDVTQFNACLSVEALKDNLEAVTDRVYDRSYQRIVLDKLNQAYPGGVSDEVLQVLGSASRAATRDDVRKWNVTKIDTLSSLMNQRYGDWDAEMVQLLVSKYLSVNGNTLGTNELNTLGGTNLCVLNTSVLSNITPASMERASALSLTSCSSEKKSILFSIAQNAFDTTNTRSTNTVSITTYQLLQNYLGGADSMFIRTLVNSSVNMDVLTFMSLKQSVINVLNVPEVKSLLGVNVGDLKTYESAAQIQEWIRLQLQSDLDTLQMGLTGGRNSTATETTTSTASAATSSTKAPSAQTGTVATTAAGSRVWSPDCLQLLLLAVTMMTLQLLH
ncbi:uncharacterized protein mslnb isoform X1 [Labeo rohita]|uniref:uncharacterized protein mslnb isoform X1 n=1 Tax=Labeo rohita TaxID=84645 RepID=UPI0021E286CD|nr:uncharacterized protein mslnb isoform X1 [Labeo rohita]